MNTGVVRAAIAAFAFTFAFGVQAADNKSGDNKLSRGDRAFIADAAKDGMAEVELGKIAQQNAASDEVKKFGQRMVDDHTKANSELMAIAGKIGYEDKKKSDKQPSEVRKFSKMTGEKFDREYSQFMVKDHEKAVRLFRKQADKGDNAELKQFASATLPTCRWK